MNRLDEENSKRISEISVNLNISELRNNKILYGIIKNIIEIEKKINKFSDFTDEEIKTLKHIAQTEYKEIRKKEIKEQIDKLNKELEEN